MELIGQYVIICMNPREAWASLAGISAADDSEDKNVLVSGRVVGETPGVGLWIEVDSACDISRELDPESEGDGEELMPTFEKFLRPRLVRWEFISNASVFPEKPPIAEVIGFRSSR
jgi:hypothetical protein